MKMTFQGGSRICRSGRAEGADRMRKNIVLMSSSKKEGFRVEFHKGSKVSGLSFIKARRFQFHKGSKVSVS